MAETDNHKVRGRSRNGLVGDSALLCVSVGHAPFPHKRATAITVRFSGSLSTCPKLSMLSASCLAPLLVDNAWLCDAAEIGRDFIETGTSSKWSRLFPHNGYVCQNPRQLSSVMIRG